MTKSSLFKFLFKASLVFNDTIPKDITHKILDQSI
jgi:hypothetical protein